MKIQKLSVYNSVIYN